jgi:hypothetical protein
MPDAFGVDLLAGRMRGSLTHLLLIPFAETSCTGLGLVSLQPFLAGMG